MKNHAPSLDELLSYADDARARVSEYSDAQRADLEESGRDVIRNSSRHERSMDSQG
jgi:hypothetical protein